MVSRGIFRVPALLRCLERVQNTCMALIVAMAAHGCCAVVGLVGLCVSWVVRKRHTPLNLLTFRSAFARRGVLLYYNPLPARDGKYESRWQVYPWDSLLIGFQEVNYCNAQCRPANAARHANPKQAAASSVVREHQPYFKLEARAGSCYAC